MGVAATFAAPRPQGGYGGYSAGPGLSSFGSTLSSGVGPDCTLKIKCTPRLNQAGVWDVTCDQVNPCVIQREDILWLSGAPRQERLNVVVPNYKLEEVIKAAFKSNEVPGANVNIFVKRPHYTVDAEASLDFPPAGPPDVNVEYEQAPPPQKVHYPVDRPYRPLSGPILEPLGSNF